MLHDTGKLDYFPEETNKLSDLCCKQVFFSPVCYSQIIYSSATLWYLGYIQIFFKKKNTQKLTVINFSPTAVILNPRYNVMKMRERDKNSGFLGFRNKN